MPKGYPRHNASNMREKQKATKRILEPTEDHQNDPKRSKNAINPASSHNRSAVQILHMLTIEDFNGAQIVGEQTNDNDNFLMWCGGDNLMLFMEGAAFIQVMSFIHEFKDNSIDRCQCISELTPQFKSMRFFMTSKMISEKPFSLVKSNSGRVAAAETYEDFENLTWQNFDYTKRFGYSATELQKNFPPFMKLMWGASNYPGLPHNCHHIYVKNGREVCPIVFLALDANDTPEVPDTSLESSQRRMFVVGVSILGYLYKTDSCVPAELTDYDTLWRGFPHELNKNSDDAFLWNMNTWYTPKEYQEPALNMAQFKLCNGPLIGYNFTLLLNAEHMKEYGQKIPIVPLKAPINKFVEEREKQKTEVGKYRSRTVAYHLADTDLKTRILNRNVTLSKGKKTNPFPTIRKIENQFIYVFQQDVRPTLPPRPPRLSPPPFEIPAAKIRQLALPEESSREEIIVASPMQEQVLFEDENENEPRDREPQTVVARKEKVSIGSKHAQKRLYRASRFEDDEIDLKPETSSSRARQEELLRTLMKQFGDNFTGAKSVHTRKVKKEMVKKKIALTKSSCVYRMWNVMTTQQVKEQWKTSDFLHQFFQSFRMDKLFTQDCVPDNHIVKFLNDSLIDKHPKLDENGYDSTLSKKIAFILFGAYLNEKRLLSSDLTKYFDAEITKHATELGLITTTLGGSAITAPSTGEEFRDIEDDENESNNSPDQ